MDLFNLMQISVQDMMLVQAISKKGSVSEAAKTVRVSQPTASYRLNKLREIFSDGIFFSANRQMHPTPKGTQIIEAFEKQLANLQLLGTDQAFDPANTSRTFRIITQGFQNPALLSKVPDFFFGQTSNAKLFIEPPETDRPVNLQLSDSADFITCPFESIGARGIRRFVSPKLNVGVYYDSTMRDPPKTVDAYLDARFVALNSTKATPSIVNKALTARSTKERKIVGYAPTVETLAKFIEGTDLVFVGAAFPVDSATSSIAVADVPFEMEPVRHEVRWSISRESDDGHTWLRNLIMKVAYDNLFPSFHVDTAEEFVVLSEFESLDKP